MFRVGFALLLCGLPFGAPSLVAAEGASTFTEAELVEAVAGNPATEAALVGERERARAEVRRAARLPNPSLEATREELDGATETTAAFRWALPRPGRRALAREVALKGLESAEARLEAGRLALHLELRALYAGWAVAWHRGELLAAQLDSLRRLAEKEQARAAAGEISGLAARRLALEAERAAADLARAEAELAMARAAVVAWLPTLPPEARPRWPSPAAASTAPLDRLGVPARPDVLAHRRELERAEAQARLSQMVFEAPSLALGWKRSEERGGSAAGAVFAVGWTLPLFDRLQADRLEAEARLASARAELERVEARVPAEVSGALAAYQRLRGEAERADLATAGLAELKSAAEAAYSAGEAGLTDLLDTLRSVAETQRTALELRAAALGAARELDAALGASPPAFPSASSSSFPTHGHGGQP